jgi:hypothetical protein
MNGQIQAFLLEKTRFASLNFGEIAGLAKIQTGIAVSVLSLTRLSTDPIKPRNDRSRE